jgi:hypothetical protein
MKNLIFLLLTLIAFGTFSCKKEGNTEQVVVSVPPFQVGQPVSSAAPLTGCIKGTMKSGETYLVGADICVAEGDTLLIQEDVKVLFTGNFNFIVKGTLLSLGTQEKPNWITFKGAVKTDEIGADPLKDPAYQGLWGGLMAETKSPLMVIKWTHVEFGGGKAAVSPVSYIANGGTTYPVNFSNPDGVFVFEDSWIYGAVDDPIRPFGGKLHVMRNTFEKCGFTGGEGLNIKSGCVGNIAYNVFIGIGTNGPKASNNGGKNPQTEIAMYNNTMIACGYRRAAAGRGGSLNFEEGSKGFAYNNLMVNCKFGLRIVGSANYSGNVLVIADTANIKYGYNYNYVDSLSIANQIYPTPFLTKPQSTDIPNPSTFLPAGYKLGDVYDGSSVVGKNNPQFVNFPLPQKTALLRDINTQGKWDFRLATGSPAIGKGFTAFTPLANGVPVSEKFGATEITGPGADMGAYQSNGKGNKH